VVGLGKAAEIAKQEMEADTKHAIKLRDRFLEGIKASVADVQINGDMEHRIPHNLNISFAYIEGESMIMAIRDLAVSSGSACTSASLEPSYVLRALGLDEEMAHTSIRFGFGRFTTEEEIDHAIKVVSGNVAKLREMSPLWEMVQEGIDLKTIEWAAH
jgi:cysteine desulfurase